MGTVKLVVHSFVLSDVDDPEIYAAEPLWHWQQTEAGKWVMDNAIETSWHRSWDHHTMAQVYKVVSTLTEENATWYQLKYDRPNI